MPRFAFFFILVGNSTDPEATGLFAGMYIGFAVGIWLLGRASLYVLAGR